VGIIAENSNKLIGGGGGSGGGIARNWNFFFPRFSFRFFQNTLQAMEEKKYIR